MMKLKLHWQILIALVLAVIAGTLTGTEGSLFGITFYSVYLFIGTLFLNALKMLISSALRASVLVPLWGVLAVKHFFIT